jgi:hypothetical protein
MTNRPPLRPWNSGDDITAGRLNRMQARINEAGRTIGGGGTNSTSLPGIGSGTSVSRGRLGEFVFKARIKTSNADQIEVGFLRDNGDYQLKDAIHVRSADGSLSTVDKSSASETVAATADGWVYYEVNTSTPSATLKFSATWPPSGLSAGKAVVEVGTVVWDSTNSIVAQWHQNLEHNPTVSLGGPHPFRAEIHADGDKITVGIDRGEDTISIYHPTDGTLQQVVSKTAEETTSSISATAYVYYSFYQDATKTWTVELETSATWPPTYASASDNVRLILGIGKATWSGASIGAWEQWLFECPVIHSQRPIARSFEPWYIKSGATESIVIAPGKVYLMDDAGSSATTNQATVSLAGDTDVWCEITVAPDTNAVISATLQTGTYEKFRDTTGGTLTINWYIGHVNQNADYVIHHIGDILIPATLYQPDINTDVQGTNGAQSVRLPGLATIADTGTDTNDVLLKLREQDVDFLGGQVSKITDDGAKTLYGATIAANTTSMLETINISTANRVTFDSRDVEIEAAKGLVQDLGLTVGAAVPELACDATWIEINDGVWIHADSPAISDSGQRWFDFYGSTSGSSLDLQIFVDKKGHIWKYASTTQPGVSTRKLFRHCTNLNLVAASPAGTFTVGKIYEGDDDACYEYMGTTERAADAAPPTIGDSPEYDTCAACGGAATQYKKCYFDTLTSDTAGTNPCSVSDPSGTPTICGDVDYLYFTDLFGGSSLDTCRWTETTTGAASITVTGGVCQQNAPNDSQAYITSFVTSGAISTGDFTAEINFSGLSLTMASLTHVNFSVVIAGTGYIIRMVKQSGFNSGNTMLRVQDSGGIRVQEDKTGTTSGAMKLVRAGTSLKAYFDAVLKWTWTIGAASSVTIMRPSAISSDGGGGDSAYWDVEDFTLT